MAKKQKPKIRYIDLKRKGGAFTALFRKFGIAGEKHAGIEFSDITSLRQLLSNEKARILHTMQEEKPVSIYKLAKLLGRDFKSVRKDITLLKSFDLIRLEKGSKGKRKLLKPVLNLDMLQINIRV